MNRVVLLHGNGGSLGTDNWQPYIKAELGKLGVECLSPDLPDNALARKEYWFPYFDTELKLSENDLVVGHSSGALAILKYVETHKIGGSVLVGVYYTDLGYEDERNSGYFDTPWNWDAIKANQPWTAIFASEDDPYISIEEPRYIAEQLSSEYYELQREGHFGGHNQPKREFPELLDLLITKLGLAKN
jgi:predicted alpha/beta hydrolase family esterase